MMTEETKSWTSIVRYQDITKQISAASFEAAAISAAMDFESRAVKIYSERAESATDTNEKELYKMLADWETGHNVLLHKINDELKEEISEYGKRYRKEYPDKVRETNNKRSPESVVANNKRGMERY